MRIKTFFYIMRLLVSAHERDGVANCYEEARKHLLTHPHPRFHPLLLVALERGEQTFRN